MQRSRIYKALLPFVDLMTGAEGEQWARKAADIQIRQLIETLGPANLDTLEISGRAWEHRAKFKSYTVADYPEHDICSERPAGSYDLIVAEHVFEHLLYPYRAAKNVYTALRPGGYFLMVTPFLVGLHPCPHDCTRWTEEGAKYFLSECGFPLESTRTGSWGNRQCVVGNFHHAVRYRRLLHSLENQSNLPVTVWTLGAKAR